MAPRTFDSFSAFWPYYAAEHSNPMTRILHAVGTVTGLVLAIGAIIMGKWWWLALAFVPGYGLAWIGHFFFEKNKPATFQYPLWSFMSDWKMLSLMMAGRMSREVERAMKSAANSEQSTTGASACKK